MNVLQRRYTLAELSTVCLLVLAPVFRLALLTGPIGSDDINYFHFAEQLAHFEPYSRLHHHGGRLVFLLLVGVPAALIGSITSGAILNVAVLTFRDLFVVWFVRRETDMPCTAIAAAILALNAISLCYAGIMTPDPLLSLLMFASAVALYYGRDARTTSRGRLVAIAGALVAASYSAKDSGILLAAPSLIWVATKSSLKITERGRLVALYAGGLILVAALESLAFRLISGDWLYRSHALSKEYNATVVEAPGPLAFLHAVYWNLRSVTTLEVASTQVLVASLVVFVVALATRCRLAFFSASGLFFGAYFIFGSSSFTRFMPLPVQDRYFEPLVAFLAVGSAALVFHFRKAAPSWSVRAAAIAVTAMLVASVPSITANAGDITFSGIGKNAATALRSIHAARPEAAIYVSPMFHSMIEPFVSPELFATLRPMDPGSTRGNPLPPGFYLNHPWETDSALLGPLRNLPVYLVVDEDQRILGRYAIEPRPTDRGAIVHVQRD